MAKTDKIEILGTLSLIYPIPMPQSQMKSLEEQDETFTSQLLFRSLLTRCLSALTLISTVVQKVGLKRQEAKTITTPQETHDPLYLFR